METEVVINWNEKGRPHWGQEHRRSDRNNK